MDKIQQSKFLVSPQEPDKDWVNELEAVTIRRSLQDEGYFRAYIEITPYLVRAESRERFFAISIAIESGPRYRLSEIHVVNSTVFAPNELRKQIQLSPGEVFDVSKIRDGIEAITRIYATKGYIDATVEPEANIDESKALIDVDLKLDEGKQYRVGSVKILGLSTNAEKALRSLLEPGSVFNSRSLEDFLKKSKSLLPIDASVDNSITILRNTKDATLEIVLDFRRCSKA